jgi:ribosomal protein S18 acetylase RimI-like enzyme
MLKGEYLLIIKKLQPGDLAKYKKSIMELLIDSYKISFRFSQEQCVGICEGKLKLLNGYINEGSALVFGAFLDENLIGFLWLYKHNFFYETRLHVNQIVVNSQFRGRGIGKQLMKEVEKQAEQLGVETIDLFVSESNREAMKMYTEMGYETERRLIKKGVGGKYNAINS